MANSIEIDMNESIDNRNESIDNRNESPMDIEYQEENEEKFKCEYCQIDVRNISSLSYTCVYCKKSCCSSLCSPLALNARKRGLQKFSIEFEDFEHICAKCTKQKLRT